MTSAMTKISLLLVAAICVGNTAAFAPVARPASPPSALRMENYQEEPEQDKVDILGAIGGAVGNFFGELDAFIDDATSRRLGNGAAFYGKRKSSFYGKTDSMKKRDRNVSDNTEDYRGPAAAGYFQWQQDEETGEMKPVSRLKKRNLERRY